MMMMMTTMKAASAGGKEWLHNHKNLNFCLPTKIYFKGYVASAVAGLAISDAAHFPLYLLYASFPEFYSSKLFFMRLFAIVVCFGQCIVSSLGAPKKAPKRKCLIEFIAT